MLGSFLGKQTGFGSKWKPCQRTTGGEQRGRRLVSTARSSSYPPATQKPTCMSLSDCYSRREFMYVQHIREVDGEIHLCVFIFLALAPSNTTWASAHARNSIFQNAGGTCPFERRLTPCVYLASIELLVAIVAGQAVSSHGVGLRSLPRARNVSASAPTRWQGNPVGWITPSPSSGAIAPFVVQNLRAADA